jgi:FHA domain-containing protein
MIKIAVVSYNNETPPAAISAVFGAERGSIGRSDDNFLVLADPNHYVSRSQAQVWSDGDSHMLVNLSQANPILINGQEIEPERDYEIWIGDEIQIGLYSLRAEAAPGAHEAKAAMRHPVESDVAATASQATPAASDNAHDSQALLQAFLNGAGIPSVAISSGLTVELMETLGKLLDASIQGTMELIALRALVKREVHAEVTIVVMRKNNPLKFFPDSQTVLIQMLRKKMPGFMGPEEALEDAYMDLRAHQLGVVAGMRAAMDAMLKRLHPGNFEKKLPTPGFLDYLNPSRAKARLWDMYAERFKGIFQEAKDDFQSLFGKDFRNAYEKEIERFENEQHTESQSVDHH